jgi:hypothetical protein
MPMSNSDIEAARAKAFHNAFVKKCAECRDKGFREPSSTDYGMGYGDGYAAAKEEVWVRIESEDDLPKERCRCIAKYTDQDGYEVVRFYPNNTASAAYWLGNFSRYMPIPPYTEPQGGK